MLLLYYSLNTIILFRPFVNRTPAAYAPFYLIETKKSHLEA